MKIFLKEAEVKKKAQSFNQYTLEVSYGELKGIHTAVSALPGAMFDELRSSLEFFFKRLPPPGAEEPKKGEKGEGGEDKSPLIEEPESEEEVLPPDAPAEPGHVSKPGSAKPEEEQVMGDDLGDGLPDPY